MLEVGKNYKLTTKVNGISVVYISIPKSDKDFIDIMSFPANIIFLVVGELTDHNYMAKYKIFFKDDLYELCIKNNLFNFEEII